MQHRVELAADGVLDLAQLPHRAPDLAGDVGEAVWSEDQQRDQQDDEDFRRAKAHAAIRDRRRSVTPDDREGRAREALPDATAAPLALCTDNAAMIASVARWARPLEYPRYLALDAYASR